MSPIHSTNSIELQLKIEQNKSPSFFADRNRMESLPSLPMRKCHTQLATLINWGNAHLTGDKGSYLPKRKRLKLWNNRDSAWGQQPNLIGNWADTSIHLLLLKRSTYKLYLIIFDDSRVVLYSNLSKILLLSHKLQSLNILRWLL